MKPVYAHLSGALALSFALAACVPAPAPTPAPTPTPASRPSPTPSPVVQAPRYDSYLDAPQTPGDWTYRKVASGGIAQFGQPGTGPSFLLACDRSRNEIELWRPGTASSAVQMRIHTETGIRVLSASQAEDTSPYLVATLNARDPLLDAMAVTKGRFAVETQGLPTLYLPSWAEVTRVVEDCR